MNNIMKSFAIGVFDSGVGGLSVLRAIRQKLPNEHLIYFGDQYHVPYGSRPPEEIRLFSNSITRFFKSKDIKILVIACNTASAVALKYLRAKYPEIPFVGMEPAVKPAAETSQTGVIGILATSTTFQGALYSSVVERFAGNVTLIQSTCPGLVLQIEKGDLSGKKTRAILQTALRPMLKRGIDRVVLGCTHYPFVIPVIREIVGPNVQVIDPSPAVAQQVVRVLDGMGLRSDDQVPKKVEFFTSGKLINFNNILPSLFEEGGLAREVRWNGNEIQIT
jgi:glutamate racemase